MISCGLVSLQHFRRLASQLLLRDPRLIVVTNRVFEEDVEELAGRRWRCGRCRYLSFAYAIVSLIKHVVL